MFLQKVRAKVANVESHHLQVAREAVALPEVTLVTPRVKANGRENHPVPLENNLETDLPLEIGLLVALHEVNCKTAGTSLVKLVLNPLGARPLEKGINHLVLRSCKENVLKTNVVNGI